MFWQNYVIFSKFAIIFYFFSVAAICAAYESGHSLEDATKAAGTCARTFQLWRNEFTDVAEQFEKAVTVRRENRRESLADLTETAFVTLLKGGRTVRRIYRYDPETKKRYLAQMEITTHPPNPTAAIFLAKALLGLSDTGGAEFDKDKALGEAVDESVLFKSIGYENE